MGLRIKTNVASLNAQRNLSISTAATGENMAKLSSGLRINKAADEAAWRSSAEQMNAKIRSLGQAKRNAQDGVSLVQVAEGSMNEVSNIPAGGITRRTGRRTGSVSSKSRVLSDARNVPPRTGNHDSTARPARITR